MATAWEYLERLSRHPHRGTGTAGEQAAAADMKRWLDDLGYTVEVQPFKTPQDTLYLGPATLMFGFALALLWPVPWLGLVVCVLGFIPLVGELTGSLRVDLDRLLANRAPSQNLVARRPPARGKAARTVVLSAHYDTQRATWLFHPRFVPWIPIYFHLAYAGMGLTPVVLLLRWALPGAGWAGAAAIGLSLFLAANVVFLLWQLTGRFIQGANDNGSGTALVLALADRFARSPLLDTEVIFLLTGAEEVGTRGMKHFLRTTRLDPATTRFINLDNLGGGIIHYLAGEGMVKVQPYSASLIALAEQLAAEHGRPIRRKANLLLPTDGLVPSAAGYEAISFLAFNEDGSLPNYHWHTDTIERVDRDLLAFAEAYFANYLLHAARGAETPESLGRPVYTSPT